MAITQTGSTLRFENGFNNSGTVSTTITVPSDAEIVVVGVTAVRSTNHLFSSGAMTFTKGGVDTAMVMGSGAGGDGNTSATMGGIFYLVLPDTGANKTLKWDWEGTQGLDFPCLCTVNFWKGVDTTSPVRDGDAAQVVGAPPVSTPSLTAQTDDLIVAMAGWFSGAGDATVDTWSNLSLLTQVTIYTASNIDAAWATKSPTGNTTVGVSTASAWDDGSISAIVLKPPTITTPAPPPVYPLPREIVPPISSFTCTASPMMQQVTPQPQLMGQMVM